MAALLLLFGSMFSIGGFLLLQPLTGWLNFVAAVIGGIWLRQINKSQAPPTSRPGLEGGTSTDEYWL